MGRQVLMVVFLLAGSLAGCIGSGPKGPGPSGDVHEGDVETSGQMRIQDGVWLVDVQAYNAGDTTLGYAQSYCQGTAWVARLSGPPGENLTYRDPQANRLGCPGFTSGRFEPDTWQNWTADPSCDTYYVCDNQWDGRIWPKGEVDAGDGEPAPAGTYTWTFTFPYFDQPGYTDDQGGAYHNPEGRHVKTLEFTVEIG